MAYNIQMNYFDGSSYQELNPKTIPELINCHYMNVDLPLSSVLTNVEFLFNSYAKQLVYKTTYIGTGTTSQMTITTTIIPTFFIVFGSYNNSNNSFLLFFAGKNVANCGILKVSTTVTSTVYASFMQVQFNEANVLISPPSIMNESGKTYHIVLFQEVSNT